MQNYYIKQYQNPGFQYEFLKNFIGLKIPLQEHLESKNKDKIQEFLQWIFPHTPMMTFNEFNLMVKVLNAEDIFDLQEFHLYCQNNTNNCDKEPSLYFTKQLMQDMVHLYRTNIHQQKNHRQYMYVVELKIKSSFQQILYVCLLYSLKTLYDLFIQIAPLDVLQDDLISGQIKRDILRRKKRYSEYKYIQKDENVFKVFYSEYIDHDVYLQGLKMKIPQWKNDFNNIISTPLEYLQQLTIKCQQENLVNYLDLRQLVNLKKANLKMNIKDLSLPHLVSELTIYDLENLLQGDKLNLESIKLHRPSRFIDRLKNKCQIGISLFGNIKVKMLNNDQKGKFELLQQLYVGWSADVFNNISRLFQINEIHGEQDMPIFIDEIVNGEELEILDLDGVILRQEKLDFSEKTRGIILCGIIQQNNVQNPQNPQGIVQENNNPVNVQNEQQIVQENNNQNEQQIVQENNNQNDTQIVQQNNNQNEPIEQEIVVQQQVNNHVQDQLITKLQIKALGLRDLDLMFFDYLQEIVIDSVQISKLYLTELKNLQKIEIRNRYGLKDITLKSLPQLEFKYIKGNLTDVIKMMLFQIKAPQLNLQHFLKLEDLNVCDCGTKEIIITSDEFAKLKSSKNVLEIISVPKKQMSLKIQQTFEPQGLHELFEFCWVEFTKQQ